MNIFHLQTSQFSHPKKNDFLHKKINNLQLELNNLKVKIKKNAKKKKKKKT